MAGFGDEEVLGSSYPDTQVLLPLLAHVLLHRCVYTNLPYFEPLLGLKFSLFKIRNRFITLQAGSD